MRLKVPNLDQYEDYISLTTNNLKLYCMKDDMTITSDSKPVQHTMTMAESNPLTELIHQALHKKVLETYIIKPHSQLNARIELIDKPLSLFLP